MSLNPSFWSLSSSLDLSVSFFISLEERKSSRIRQWREKNWLMHKEVLLLQTSHHHHEELESIRSRELHPFRRPSLSFLSLSLYGLQTSTSLSSLLFFSSSFLSRIKQPQAPSTERKIGGGGGRRGHPRFCSSSPLLFLTYSTCQRFKLSLAMWSTS